MHSLIRIETPHGAVHTSRQQHVQMHLISPRRGGPRLRQLPAGGGPERRSARAAAMLEMGVPTYGIFMDEKPMDLWIYGPNPFMENYGKLWKTMDLWIIHLWKTMDLWMLFWYFPIIMDG